MLTLVMLWRSVLLSFVSRTLMEVHGMASSNDGYIQTPRRYWPSLSIAEPGIPSTEPLEASTSIIYLHVHMRISINLLDELSNRTRSRLRQASHATPRPRAPRFSIERLNRSLVGARRQEGNRSACD